MKKDAKAPSPTTNHFGFNYLRGCGDGTNVFPKFASRNEKGGGSNIRNEQVICFQQPLRQSG